MKITPLQALTVVSGITWGAVAIEAIADRLPVKPFAVLLGAAVTSSIVAGMHRHADRMKAVTANHADVMTRHMMTMNQVFKIGQQAEQQIRDDVADKRAIRLRDWPATGRGTGPFPVYKDA